MGEHCSQLQISLVEREEESWEVTVTQNMGLGTDGVGSQDLQRHEDLWPEALPRELFRGGGRAGEREGVSHR